MVSNLGGKHHRNTVDIRASAFASSWNHHRRPPRLSALGPPARRQALYGYNPHTTQDPRPMDLLGG